MSAYANTRCATQFYWIPMRSLPKNSDYAGSQLQEFGRVVGAPDAIVRYCARSRIGEKSFFIRKGRVSTISVSIFA
jgi:hypothetical protein